MSNYRWDTMLGPIVTVAFELLPAKPQNLRREGEIFERRYPGRGFMLKIN